MQHAADWGQRPLLGCDGTNLYLMCQAAGVAAIPACAALFGAPSSSTVQAGFAYGTLKSFGALPPGISRNMHHHNSQGGRLSCCHCKRKCTSHFETHGRGIRPSPAGSVTLAAHPQLHWHHPGLLVAATSCHCPHLISGTAPRLCARLPDSTSGGELSDCCSRPAAPPSWDMPAGLRMDACPCWTEVCLSQGAALPGWPRPSGLAGCSVGRRSGCLSPGSCFDGAGKGALKRRLQSGPRGTALRVSWDCCLPRKQRHRPGMGPWAGHA